MYLINLSKNEDGSYPPIQKVTHNKVLPLTAKFPEMFYNIFYQSGKRAAGFVDLTMDGNTITNVTWNEEAYQAWCEANPEQPEPEPEEPIDTRVSDLEEALDVILTGVTE